MTKLKWNFVPQLFITCKEFAVDSEHLTSDRFTPLADTYAKSGVGPFLCKHSVGLYTFTHSEKLHLDDVRSPWHSFRTYRFVCWTVQYGSSQAQYLTPGTPGLYCVLWPGPPLTMLTGLVQACWSGKGNWVMFGHGTWMGNKYDKLENSIQFKIII